MAVPWGTPPPLVETTVFPDAVAEFCGVAGAVVFDAGVVVEEVADVVEEVEDVDEEEEEADVVVVVSGFKTLKPFEKP
jgi:hypothetical protein